MSGKSIDYSYYDEVEHWPKYLKKKKSKRWCKGRVGREHEPVVELNHKMMTGSRKECRPDGWWGCYHHEVCKNCGKELKFIVRCPNFPDVGLKRWPWS